MSSEIRDPQHELRSGMFADFDISLGQPIAPPPSRSMAGRARATDHTTWVTADRRRSTRRTARYGQEHEGYRQILDGVRPVDLVATEALLLLSHELAIATTAQ